MNQSLKNIFLNCIAVASIGFAASSCHNPVFDYEGDCEVDYYIRFVYDMNLKWANAFPSEVTSVNLYAFNDEGVFVKEFYAAGEALADPTYAMQLELDPGDYTLVAWCGIGNEEGKGESFTVTDPQPGVTTLEEFTCSLNTLSSQEYEVYSDTELKFLYQGNMSVSLPDIQDGEDRYYTMYLTKDTNHVRIILQELSGDNMDPSDYAITIEAEDADMAYDNSIIGSTEVTYLPWAQVSDQMGLDDGTGNIKYNMGIISDLSTARMIAGEENEMFLTIRNSDNGDIIARIPIIQYALLTRQYYEQAYGHEMTDQEFLDREDEYQLTFFLSQGRWISTYIYINSWRVVIHDYDVES